MKCWTDVKKRDGSCNCTRNGAVLQAVRTSACDWKTETHGLKRLRELHELNERLREVQGELNERQHSTFVELESSGLFGGFHVLDRRGYWRVEFSVWPDLLRASIDEHSNFGVE